MSLSIETFLDQNKNSNSCDKFPLCHTQLVNSVRVVQSPNIIKLKMLLKHQNVAWAMNREWKSMLFPKNHKMSFGWRFKGQRGKKSFRVYQLFIESWKLICIPTVDRCLSLWFVLFIFGEIGNFQTPKLVGPIQFKKKCLLTITVFFGTQQWS